ncbi:MAG: peptidoglycan-binding protein [Bryobacterales bacterium]|nr:peptidoglycan-binding protein [Bryobacterales bacterium]
MRPILRMGSFGPDVKDLQGLLNGKPTSLPRLDPDGAFGPRTGARVREFQTSQRLSVDGVVGNNTWNALLGGPGGASGIGSSPQSSGGSAGTQNHSANTPSNGAMDVPAPTPGVSPGSEDAARERIRQIAVAELATYGWNPAERPSVQNPRIAAKLCADASTRARQGAKHLTEIFTGAGVSAARCPTISVEAERMYQRKYDAAERNRVDIVSWCGIFSLYVHRMAGLKVSGWPLKYSIGGKSKPGDEYRIKLANKPPKVGDIGVVEPTGLNHHFVIVGVDGTTMQTVDGNSGLFSEIVGKTYTLSGVQGKGGYFLEPIWERVL